MYVNVTIKKVAYLRKRVGIFFVEGPKGGKLRSKIPLF